MLTEGTVNKEIKHISSTVEVRLKLFALVLKRYIIRIRELP
jgi:hypothetical protein